MVANRRVFVAAQVVAAALLIWFVGREFARQWADFRATPLVVDLRWGSLAASATLVLGTYALLIQVWRMLMASGGVILPFWRAARIWSISNLWKYVPGKVWSIGAMAAMAQREQVPAASAASASVLGVVLNIATGIAITALMTWRWLGEFAPGAQVAAIVLLVAALLGLISLPYTLPRLAAFASRVTEKNVTVQAPPPIAIGIAVVANMISWGLYGLAFRWLASGVTGGASGAGGATWQYIAVFTASYVVGYLFLIAPGGIGAREAVMLPLLTSLGLATPKEAALVTVASRLWLTILEIIPGVLFLAAGSRPKSHPSNTPDVRRE